MKRNTLTLLMAVGLCAASFGQVTTVLQAPQTDGSWSTLHAPSGSLNAVSHRACYLVKQTELTGLALTNSIITGFGFDFLNGVNAPTSGQFTVYLQNTGDATYLKGTNYPTAISTMGPARFLGTYSIPVAAASPTSIVLTLTTPFTYTGGGIYVAFEWNSPSAAATTPARYNCNTTGLTPTGGSYTFTSSGPAATTMSLDVFRPAFLWAAANSATNEASVEDMFTLGKVSKQFNANHPVTATIRNNSSVSMSNIPVTLTVSGANPVNTVVTIPSLAAGATTVITWGYNPTALGLNNMTVSLPSDQKSNNNVWVWSQTVTCNDFSFIPPLPASTFTDVQYGLNPSGVYAYEFIPPANCNLTGVKMIVSNNAAAVGVQLNGVVVDISNGNVLASTNTITITGGMAQTEQLMTFATPYALTAGTNYYIGVAQLPGSATASYPFTSLTPSYPINNFYRSNPVGTPLTQADRGYLAIGAVIGTSLTSLTASATKTAVCKGKDQVVVTATGADVYAWTPASLGSSPSITFTPTSPTTAQTSTFISVIGNYTTGPASGCKSNAVNLTFALSACTGLIDNTGADAVRVFPNPSVSGKTTITNLSGVNSITIFNSLGQVVLTQTTSNDTEQVDISQYPAGNYMMKITNSNNESRTIKLVNQN